MLFQGTFPGFVLAVDAVKLYQFVMILLNCVFVVGIEQSCSG